MATEQILFSASIIVAFLSGMVALFAPCCITFLLPAYLGQILRVRAKILIGTIAFGLGIATIMLPIALGFRVLIAVFQEWHTLTYVLGGLMMVFFGVWTLLGKEIKLPFAPPQLSNKIELSSLYVLGIFSGITSACCAPVLIGALLLAGLSVTFLKTVLVGFAYVAGMVFPLFIGALLWKSNPLTPVRSFLAKPISFRWGSRQKEFSLGHLISGLIFTGFGISLAVLALLGKIAMPTGVSRAGAVIGYLVVKVGSFIKHYPFLEYLFLGLLIILIILFIKRVKKDTDSKL